jgi:hypothetical protein
VDGRRLAWYGSVLTGRLTDGRRQSSRTGLVHSTLRSYLKPKSSLTFTGSAIYLPLDKARRSMKVLVACECSGKVRDAFAKLGHDAWSCDIKPTESPGNHIQGDVRDALTLKQWDLIIAHPPCTYLSVSGLHWNKRRPDRAALTEEALDFARLFFDHPCPRIAIENPISCISSRIRKPDQIIQPYEFGHDASKKTCLWLKGLPKLEPTGPYIKPRIVAGRPRWSNQTDSGQNALPPSKNRAAIRSETYEGVAKAMAEQWGGSTGSKRGSPSSADDCESTSRQNRKKVRISIAIEDDELIESICCERPAECVKDGVRASGDTPPEKSA